ncbi:MAG: sulfatase-like hydrolase/transferase [Candidatus Dormibacteria bacterium]
MSAQNILLVVYDTTRADVLEPYGAGEGTSPALAQLARRGSAVPRVMAPASWTVPSHAAMFAGLMPRSMGLGQAPGGTPLGVRPALEVHRDRLLAEVLRRQGFATRAISANLWISAGSGFDIGFEDFRVTSARQYRGFDSKTRRGAAEWALSALRARLDGGAAEVERALREWSGSAGTRPFFWFVNLIECHSPYLPPRPYNDLRPWWSVAAGMEARRHLTLDAVWSACAGGVLPSPPVIARMRHLYARSARLLDDWLGRVMQLMDAAGVLDDTLLVVTSDHGENLGEGGLMGHAFSLDDRLIHVPVVAAGPGAEALERVGSLVDIPWALATATDTRDHPWQPPRDDGIAVAQFDGLAPEDDPRIQGLVASWGLDPAAARVLSQDQTCATDGQLKLLRRGPVETLFDLAADPLELTALDPADAADGARVTRLRQALEAEGMGTAPVPAGPQPVISEEARRDLERRMSILGYM